MELQSRGQLSYLSSGLSQPSRSVVTIAQDLRLYGSVFFPLLSPLSLTSRARPKDLVFWDVAEPFCPFLARMSTGIDGRHSGPRAHRRSISRGTDSVGSFAAFPTAFVPKRPANMTQSQRSRYIKTGAIIGALLLMLFWLAPSRNAVPSSRPGKHSWFLNVNWC